MLTEDGRILLTDFGIAVHHDDSALTGTGLLIGSVEYIAPERVRGGGGPVSDLFSLGVTLYQAVECLSPFRRETAGDALSAVLFDDPPEPQRAGALTQLIARLPVKDPNRRATVQEAEKLLEAVSVGGAARAPTLVTPTQPPAVAPPDARRRRRAIGALAAAEHAARACDEDDQARLIARVVAAPGAARLPRVIPDEPAGWSSAPCPDWQAAGDRPDATNARPSASPPSPRSRDRHQPGQPPRTR
nr:hypothetical protein StreXyl84_65550 [Streptomyces sp. Xyl84]